MHINNYMEHAAAIQRSIGLPGTDYHLRGEYSQVFYVFDLGITCQREMFPLGGIVVFIKTEQPYGRGLL